jgi:hypothetical protein
LTNFDVGIERKSCYSSTMSGTNWSDGENDLTVADYFDMLHKELGGVGFSKAAHRRALLGKVDRAEGAIEFKHQNISAILLGLGHPWIDGYKPASNYQAALLESVVRYLNAQPFQFDMASKISTTMQRFADVQDRTLWIGPPPTHSNTPPTVDLAKAKAVAEKFDVAERDARNRKLGYAGEELVVAHERANLEAVGRTDLADQVRWVSQLDGDGAGYDILSFEQDGTPRLVEVKTTNGWERTPFYLSRNEINVANDNRDSWHLVRLWNFVREPKAYALRPPLENYVELTPTSFLASLH